MIGQRWASSDQLIYWPFNLRFDCSTRVLTSKHVWTENFYLNFCTLTFQVMLWQPWSTPSHLSTHFTDSECVLPFYSFSFGYTTILASISPLKWFLFVTIILQGVEKWCRLCVSTILDFSRWDNFRTHWVRRLKPFAIYSLCKTALGPKRLSDNYFS